MDTYTVFRYVSEFIHPVNLYCVMSRVSRDWRSIAQSTSNPAYPKSMKECVEYAYTHGDYDLLYIMYHEGIKISTDYAVIGAQAQSQRAILWTLKIFKFNHAVMSVARRDSEGPLEYSEFMEKATSMLVNEREAYYSTNIGVPLWLMKLQNIKDREYKGHPRVKFTKLTFPVSFDFYVMTRNFDALEWMLPNVSELRPIHMCRLLQFCNNRDDRVDRAYRPMDIAQIIRLIVALANKIGLKKAIYILHGHVEMREVEFYKTLSEQLPGFEIAKCELAIYSLIKSHDIDACRWGFESGCKLGVVPGVGESGNFHLPDDHVHALEDYDEDDKLPDELQYQAPDVGLDRCYNHPPSTRSI